MRWNQWRCQDFTHNSSNRDLLCAESYSDGRYHVTLVNDGMNPVVYQPPYFLFGERGVGQRVIWIREFQL